MRSKTLKSKINLQRGKLTVENRKSREKKRICSEVSVNSPGNPCSLCLMNAHTPVMNLTTTNFDLAFHSLKVLIESFSAVFSLSVAYQHVTTIKVQ